MYFKPIYATLITGTMIATMIFVRVLAPLPLLIGCLASRMWQPGSLFATKRFPYF